MRTPVPSPRRAARLVLPLSTALALVAGALVLACVDRTEIDGSTVAPVGSEASPPDCAAVCGRLEALCGFAPVGCGETCDAEYDDAARVCVGAAPSCQEALEGCFADEGDEGEGEGEGEGDDAAAGADDASTTADGARPPDAASSTDGSADAEPVEAGPVVDAG